MKQTLALVDTPTKDNSPIAEMVYNVEAAEDGVYSVTTQTRYNAEGEPLRATQKQLISQLSHTLKNKSVFVSERGLTSSSWSEYSDNTKRTQYSLVPTSNITAEAVTVDGF